MRLENSPSTNGEVVVACDYCEALPFDAAARGLGSAILWTAVFLALR